MTSWFRSWHGAPTDTKWLSIARRAGVAPGIVSAVAWALLDYASQHEQRGRIDGFDIETYSAFSGFDESQVAAVIGAMTAKGMIEDDRWSSWDKRQPEREDNSGERVRRYRENHRNGTGVTPAQDELVTQCNAVSHNVTLGNAPDTDTDTDTEDTLTANAVSDGTPQPPPESAPKAKRTAAKKPTDPNMQHPGVMAFREIAHKFPNHVQAAAIVAAVSDDKVDLWRMTIERWLRMGWSPQNVDGMIGRFENGWADIDARRNGPQPAQEKEPAYKRAIRAFIEREGLTPNGI